MTDQDQWTVVAKKKKIHTQSLTVLPSSPQESHSLTDTWVLWIHELESDQWDITSYNQVFSFNTVEDFWRLFNNLKNLNNRMYYLMRSGYPPIWDHPKNCDGGGWTFKIDKRNVRDYWETLACFCVGETCGIKPENIVGVSVSPKIKFATVRIWTKNKDTNPHVFDNIRQETHNNISFTEARFTANSDANK